MYKRGVEGRHLRERDSEREDAWMGLMGSGTGEERNKRERIESKRGCMDGFDGKWERRREKRKVGKKVKNFIFD